MAANNAAQSLCARFLAAIDDIPNEDRLREWRPEELSKLLVTAVYAIEDLSTTIEDLREEIAALKKQLAPSKAQIGKNLFAVDQWKVLQTAQDVRDAQSFFTSYFVRLSTNPQARSLMTSIVGLMSTAVATPEMLSNASFVDSARTLLAELLVLRERAMGWPDPALEALRSSLLGASLPSEISDAYESARLHLKVTTAPTTPGGRNFQRHRRGRDAPHAGKKRQQNEPGKKDHKDE